jgi:hypothetical protein
MSFIKLLCKEFGITKEEVTKDQLLASIHEQWKLYNCLIEAIEENVNAKLYFKIKDEHFEKFDNGEGDDEDDEETK